RLSSFYPSPLVGLRGGSAAINRAGGAIETEEGAPKGWVRGQCESAKNPLIRPFAYAKAHLLPRREKGKKEQRPDGQQRGKSRSGTPSPLWGEEWGEGAM